MSRFIWYHCYSNAARFYKQPYHWWNPFHWRATKHEYSDAGSTGGYL